MKVPIVLLILLTSIIKVSLTDFTSPVLETIELELDEDKKFQIKSKEEGPINYMLNPRSVRTIIPKKYFDLIKEYFKKNSLVCPKKTVYSGGVYETFYCLDWHSVDYSKVKLHLNFENYTLTMTENQLFETQTLRHTSKLRTQSNTNMFIFGIAE